MTTLTVHASKKYDVLIGRGLLDKAGETAAGLWRGRTAALVSDSNVAPRYLRRVKDSLEGAGFAVPCYVFPAGEQSKTAGTWLSLMEFLAERRLTRADGIVALGGGVVGDLAGFAASSFLRGVGYLQVPTTVLAAVDSSVGGKTAIDLPQGKNLVGAFCQPDGVLCDLDAWRTLPPDVLSDGCAEVIKYGMIRDPALLDSLEREDFRKDPEGVTARCVSLKRDMVERDERDLGERQLLNLGHTAGHGIEAASGYTVSHGRAVAAGMTILTGAAVSLGLCPEGVLPRLEALLRKYGLPTETDLSPAELYEHTLSDKKRAGDTMTIVVPTGWGQSKLQTVSVPQWRDWLERGMTHCKTKL